MAPGATIIYAGAQNSGTVNKGNDVTGSQTIPHALIHLIDQHLADIITNSWGVFTSVNPPGLVQPMETAFMQAAAEGVSVLFGSGDSGDNIPLGNALALVGSPTESRYITTVGGTTLFLYDAAGHKDEWGWYTTISTLSSSTVSVDGTQVFGSSWTPWPPQQSSLFGSGGGTSLNFAQPDYQRGVVPYSLATTTVDASGNIITYSSPHRVVPDISMMADLYSTGVAIGETFTISSDPLANAGCTPLTATTEYCEGPSGGTSLASPMFAGVLALADQARFAAGKGVLGFVNPALYKLPVGPIGSAAPIYDTFRQPRHWHRCSTLRAECRSLRSTRQLSEQRDL
jgi:subtilase family serine protease